MLRMNQIDELTQRVFRHSLKTPYAVSPKQRLRFLSSIEAGSSSLPDAQHGATRHRQDYRQNR